MSNALMYVPMAQIKEGEVALRGVNKESEDYQDLRRSIASVGLINPIAVRERKVGNEVHYEIIEGTQRYNCMKDLGKPEIPVHVLPFDQTEILIAQIIGNSQGVETKPVEFSRQLVRISNANPTMTLSELSQKLGKSEQFVNDRLALLKIDSKYQPLVNDGTIPVSNAYHLSKLPVAEQEAWIQRAQTETNAVFAPAVKQRLSELNKAKREGREATKLEFTPVERLRSLKEVSNVLHNPDFITSFVARNNITNPIDAVKLTLQFCLGVDPDGVVAQKNAWDTRQAELAKAKEERKKEREQKAAKKAVEAGVTVSA